MAKIPHEVACAAIGADCFRFPRSADFGHWLNYPALTVEEIAALSCDRDPKVLNLKRIAEFRLSIPHPALARTQQDLMDFSALANTFEQRRDFLLRSCRHGDLPGTQVGDTYEVRVADFFPWLDRQGGKEPWDLLPDELEERVKAFRAAALGTEEKSRADSDSDANADAGKGKAAASSLGVSKAAKGEGGFSSLGDLKDKKGVREAWALIRSELRKPLDKRQFRTMRKLREHCEDTFDIGFHDCVKVSAKASQEPGSIPYKPGKPSKRKAS